MTDFDGLDTELTELEDSVEGARAVTHEFNSEIDKVTVSLASVNTDLNTFERGLSTGLKRAFDGVTLESMSLSDAMTVLGQSLSNAAYNAAITPVADGVAGAVTAGVGNLFGVSAFADGGAFVGGKVTPFAKGGVVTEATAFPMRGGTGLMGEAGPEAIMPLTRGADGQLGVRSNGGGTSNPVTINVTTPDVAGFQRSQGQIAAQVNRALSRGQRNA